LPVIHLYSAVLPVEFKIVSYSFFNNPFILYEGLAPVTIAQAMTCIYFQKVTAEIL